MKENIAVTFLSLQFFEKKLIFDVQGIWKIKRIFSLDPFKNRIVLESE